MFGKMNELAETRKEKSSKKTEQKYKKPTERRVWSRFEISFRSRCKIYYVNCIHIKWKTLSTFQSDFQHGRILRNCALRLICIWCFVFCLFLLLDILVFILSILLRFIVCFYQMIYLIVFHSKYFNMENKRKWWAAFLSWSVF